MYGYEYLKKFFYEENFRFEDKGDYFTFKVQGVGYIAFKNDAPFIQVVIPCNVPEDVTRAQALELCNRLNAQKFVTKFTLTDNSESVWCSYEFVPGEYTSSEEWMRIFSLLDRNSDELFDGFKKL